PAGHAVLRRRRRTTRTAFVRFRKSGQVRRTCEPCPRWRGDLAMKPNTRIVLVALAAGVIGAGAGLWFNGAAPLLRSEIGQRALQDVLSATAPAAPAGLAVAQRGQLIPTLHLPDLDGQPLELPAAHLS